MILIKQRLWFAIVFFISLAGCAAYKPETSAVVEEKEVRPAAKVMPSKASDQMLIQAQHALRDGDLQGAVATAERGLRIDRRSSGLYLVLAKAYGSMEDYKRASQFAEQALRFAAPESSIEQSARDYLSFLKKRL